MQTLSNSGNTANSMNSECNVAPNATHTDGTLALSVTTATPGSTVGPK
jgi:hypothetical protein